MGACLNAAAVLSKDPTLGTIANVFSLFVSVQSCFQKARTVEPSLVEQMSHEIGPDTTPGLGEQMEWEYSKTPYTDDSVDRNEPSTIQTMEFGAQVGSGTSPDPD